MEQRLTGGGSTIRPLNLGEVLDLSFRTFGRNWKPMLLIGLINAAPALIGLGVLRTVLVGGLLSPVSSPRIVAQMQRGDFSFLWGLLAGALVLGLVGALIGPLVRGALIKACSQAVLGEPIALGACFRTAAPRYFGYLGTTLLTGVGAIIAFPVLVIAGLVVLFFLTVPAGYVAAATYLVFSWHAVVLEGVTGGPAAWRRSARLVNGRFWPLMGLGAVYVVLALVVQQAFGLLVGMPLQLYYLFGSHSPVVALLGTVLPQLSTVVVLPIFYLGLTLAYYETRARKEGFDLVQAADQQLAMQP